MAQERATAAEMAKIQLSLQLAELDAARDAATDDSGVTADSTAAIGTGGDAGQGSGGGAAPAEGSPQAESAGELPAAAAAPQRQKPAALESDAEVLRRR